MLTWAILAIENESEREFIERLYAQNYAAMFQRARGILKNPQRAEDAVEVVMLKLTDRIELLRGCNLPSLRSYLLSCVRNEAIGQLRKNSKLYPATRRRCCACNPTAARLWTRSWAARGMEQDFGGEDFRTAFEVLRGIDFDVLRFTDNLNWSEDSTWLGEDCDPAFLFDFSVDCTLKIRPEDERISGVSCYIVRINPATSAEEQAYTYLRTQMLSDVQHVCERLGYDFATPAEELAAWSDGIVTAEEIETYREQVGDVWLDRLREEAQNSVVAALEAWWSGEADFEKTANALNAIYAQGPRNP